MSIQPKEIAQKLEDLLDELDNTENLINPFFRISKGTPEQIRKYSFLNTLQFFKIVGCFCLNDVKTLGWAWSVLPSRFLCHPITIDCAPLSGSSWSSCRNRIDRACRLRLRLWSHQIPLHHKTARPLWSA